jgi:O-antigen/teichoic acid export membrane protein
LRGITWNTAGLVVQTLSGLAAAVLVARYLTVRDFAVAGLAVSIAVLANVVLANTFSQLMVQREEITPEFCHSIFWFQAGCGLALTIAVAAVAPFIATFYGEPQLTAPLRAAAVLIAANSLAQVPLALLLRGMRFGAINFARGASGSASAALAIVLAATGAG